MPDGSSNPIWKVIYFDHSGTTEFITRKANPNNRLSRGERPLSDDEKGASGILNGKPIMFIITSYLKESVRTNDQNFVVKFTDDDDGIFELNNPIIVEDLPFKGIAEVGERLYFNAIPMDY